MKRKLVTMLLACVMLANAGCTQNPPVKENGETVSSDVEEQVTEETPESTDVEAEENFEVIDISDDAVLKNLPTSWDLTDLYADEDAFEADMQRVEELIPEIEKFRGTLNSADGILKDFESPELLEINAIMNKAGMYVTFLNSLDPTDAWASQANARYTEVQQKEYLAYSFETPEIMEMPLEKRQEIFSDERFEPYAYMSHRYVDPDYVVLGEEASTVETLLYMANNTSDTHDIFDYVELPRPTFTYPDGTEGVLTDEAYYNVMESNKYDHEFRKELYELRNSMRQPYAYTYASLLEGQMRLYWADAQIHGFDSSLAAALYETDVDPEVYDKTIDFAHSMLPKMYEYYAVKKELLGLDEMMICDMSLSTTDYEPKHVTYDYAVNVGREGISVWGDEYLKTFDMIITSPHVDVYPSDTKQTGAFEYLMGKETTPFVMYNFSGSESYTSTIVHEMGHAVYSEYSAENQNSYNCMPGIFTQEVASTANEIMFHKYMIENAATKEEKLYWLEQEIDLFSNTILTQCMFSEFEDYCYKTIEAGGSLDADEMSEKWSELEKLYYGDAITVQDDGGINWARIPHLYYNYYVYKYASSLTYAASICNQVDEKGQEEIDAYMEFLKAGSSADPATLLSIAGVDPMADATYDEAGKLFEELIDEYIETVKSE